MKVVIARSERKTGEWAAGEGAGLIRQALERRQEAFIILATGASQFEMFDTLVSEDIDWSRVTVFHLDEYIGIPADHPASFRRYLRDRFVDRLPRALRAFHYIDAGKNPQGECRRQKGLMAPISIDVAFVGIGENCHLAFNDPPADFETEEPYIVVDLDEACRRQQLGEGWFKSLEEVPRQAISMSIRRIMKSKTVICTVPDRRKADAVSKALEGPVTPQAPASILREHSDCRFFLDPDSASQLKEEYELARP